MNTFSVWKDVPVLEDGTFLLRKTKPQDADGLLAVYSDKAALPFFNSDNCDGDNFYYTTSERMQQALDFWTMAYENGWFVRMTILHQETGEILGTAELCRRVSEDAFDNSCILRLDLKSEAERQDVLEPVMKLLIPHLNDWFGTERIITKVPPYAIERAAAAEAAGFVPDEHVLLGKDGTQYTHYWSL